MQYRYATPKLFANRFIIALAILGAIMFGLYEDGRMDTQDALRDAINQHWHIVKSTPEIKPQGE